MPLNFYGFGKLANKENSKNAGNSGKQKKVKILEFVSRARDKGVSFLFFKNIGKMSKFIETVQSQNLQQQEVTLSDVLEFPFSLQVKTP